MKPHSNADSAKGHLARLLCQACQLCSYTLATHLGWVLCCPQARTPLIGFFDVDMLPSRSLYTELSNPARAAAAIAAASQEQMLTVLPVSGIALPSSTTALLCSPWCVLLDQH
jgi:hypothetical protein